MRSRKILLFYGLTFFFSWGIAALFVLFPKPFQSAFGPMSTYNPVFILYAYMPTIVALVLTAVLGGRVGVRTWLSRILRWRVGWQWYLAILAGVPLLAYLAAFISGRALTFNPQVALLAIFPGVLIGPLSEEPGWRGYVLSDLLERNSLLKSGLITGISWGVWHLPSYIIAGAPYKSDSLVEALVGLVLIAIGLNLLQTWVYSHTGASVFVAGIFFHLVYNVSIDVAGDPYFWMGILLFVIAGITVVFDWARYLSHLPNPD